MEAEVSEKILTVEEALDLIEKQHAEIKAKINAGFADDVVEHEDVLTLITLKEILRTLGRSEMALNLSFYPGSEKEIDITVNQVGLLSNEGAWEWRPLCTFTCDEDHLLETLGKILKLAQENIEDV